MAKDKTIRVALIGLSASAKTSWAAEGHLPYLLSPRGSSHYTIVALLNSSIAAAESARSAFNLLPTVKAYGDPEALAQDPDIDLVVCNTRVDVHYPTTAPSLQAGKHVYIEWPLTENLSKALELTKGKEYPGSIVGLQGRVMPLALRLKEILASGKIGKVLSSTVEAYSNIYPRDSVIESLTYFADRKVGGHPVNILFGHTIDFVNEVLGEFQDFHGKMQIQRPTMKVIDATGTQKGEVKTNVPDFVSIHGTLKQGPRSAEIADGATLVATSRLGPSFKGRPGFSWTIHGENGELLITAPGPFIFSGMSYTGPVTIELHDFETDEVSDLGWDWQDWQKDLPVKARITAEVYERYAEWVENGKGEVKKGREWPTLEDGVALTKFFDAFYKHFDPTWS
jgi:predicted dehydrogenase